ncbi:MAG TPA: ATP synthase F1 subunit delta [Nitrospirota bacterium]|nr:ATP synthase F1 subunit delta [Nitrospirota bacterium]
MIPTIAKRYARALVELAEKKKAVDKIKDDFASFVAAVDAQPSLRKLFINPVFTPENKKTVIRELGGKLKMQPTTQLFVEHLAETGRIRYVKEVYEAFIEILAERQNRATVRLTTAATINADDLADIKKRLEALTGKQVDIDAQVDASLIGGARARIGSVIYDGTLKSQLAKMRMKLMT